MRIAFTLPEFSSRADATTYRRLVLTACLTISGSWFAQIAFFSALLTLTQRKAPLATYFLCAYIPTIMSPWLWTRWQKRGSLRVPVIAMQLGGALFSLFQITALTQGALALFYVATFCKGFANPFVELAHDTFVVRRAAQQHEIHRANVILSTIRYGGLTIFPFLGAYCVELFGSLAVISINAVAYLGATLLLYRASETEAPSNARTDIGVIPGMHKASVSLSIRDRILLGTVFCNFCAYSFFNYLLPTHVLVTLLRTPHEFGWLTALSGVFFIGAGRLMNTAFITRATPFAMYRLVILSTVLNGWTLFAAFTTNSFLYFAVWLAIASFASFASIVTLKTVVLSPTAQNRSSNLPAIYNGTSWVGTAVGFLLCGVWGDFIPESMAIWTMAGLLTVGPLAVCLSLMQLSLGRDVGHEMAK